MKLWRDDNSPSVRVKFVKRSTSESSIIRHNSFYLPENGRSIEGYLHTSENRQLAVWGRK